MDDDTRSTKAPVPPPLGILHTPPYFAPIGSFRCALFLCAVRAVLAELGALSFARSRSDPPLRVVAHQYVAHTEMSKSRNSRPRRRTKT